MSLEKLKNNIMVSNAIRMVTKEHTYLDTAENVQMDENMKAEGIGFTVRLEGNTFKVVVEQV